MCCKIPKSPIRCEAIPGYYELIVEKNQVQKVCTKKSMPKLKHIGHWQDLNTRQPHVKAGSLSAAYSLVYNGMQMYSMAFNKLPYMPDHFRFYNNHNNIHCWE